EEAFPVADKPLLVLDGRLRRVLPPSDVLVVEPLDLLLELPQVPDLQPKAINRLQDGHEQGLDRHGEPFQFPVKRGRPEVVVDVADQVNEAFLLPARDAVVARVEVADQHTLVACEYLADDVSLPGLGHAEDDVPAI